MISIKEIMKYSSVFLRFEELEKAIEENKKYEELDLNVKKQYDLLLTATNLVVEEIASEYLNLVVVEKIEGGQDYVEFSKLRNKPKRILSVLDESKNKLHFDVLVDRVILPENASYIRYAYIPTQNYGMNDTINDFVEQLTDRVVSYAVVCEFCFISAMYEESEAWNKRFISALQNIQRKTSAGIMKKARWI